MKKIILLGVILGLISSFAFAGEKEDCTKVVGWQGMAVIVPCDFKEYDITYGRDLKVLEDKIQELERRIYELEQKQQSKIINYDLDCVYRLDDLLPICRRR